MDLVLRARVLSMGLINNFVLQLYVSVSSQNIRYPNVVLELGHRLRRWRNIKTSLEQRHVFAGINFIKNRLGLSCLDSFTERYRKCQVQINHLSSIDWNGKYKRRPLSVRIVMRTELR